MQRWCRRIFCKLYASSYVFDSGPAFHLLLLSSSLTLRFHAVGFLRVHCPELHSGRSGCCTRVELALERPLRSVDLSEEIITTVRVQRIHDRELLTAPDSKAESWNDTCCEAFGMDLTNGFARKREWAKVHKAWNKGRVMSEDKTRFDGARAHGESVCFFKAGWASFLKCIFKEKYGTNIHYESFEQELHDGTLEAETLAHVLSFAEETRQILLCTRESGTSRSCQQIRKISGRSTVTSLSLLAQMRPPGRHPNHDPSSGFLGDFLTEDNFLMYREIHGEV